MGKRENWIDGIKVLACALILVGHLLQGLQRTGILVRSGWIFSLPEFDLDLGLFQIVFPGLVLDIGRLLTFFIWFIYLFHVQLFFLCSGYLYERGERAGDFSGWLRNIGYKLVALGVPYFVFSLITWFLKNSFVDLVNIRTGHLWSFLLTSPAIAQYWYLYTLFFLFLFIPNVKNSRILMGMLAGFFILYLISGELVICFVPYSMAQYGFWFILGMVMQRLGFGKLAPKKSMLLTSLVFLILFTGLSSALYSYGYRANFTAWTLLLGTLACLGFCMLFRFIEATGFESRLVKLLVKYTFPVYLLHTIYAASIRTLLIFVGIKRLWIHVVLGLMAGVFGSLFTAWLFEKLVIPEFVFYPWKVIDKIKSRKS